MNKMEHTQQLSPNTTSTHNQYHNNEKEENNTEKELPQQPKQHLREQAKQYSDEQSISPHFSTGKF